MKGRLAIELGIMSCVLSMVFLCGVSQAGIISFDLETEYSGATPPTGMAPWLNATFDGSGGTVTLTLTPTSLTGQESVSEWMFNLDPGYDPTDLIFSEAGRTGVFDTPGRSLGSNLYKADGDGYFDIKFLFVAINGLDIRFGDGDEIVYTITATGPLSTTLSADSFDYASAPNGAGAGLYPTAAHVVSIGEDSGWITTPEPATLSLLSLGGAMLLRRRRGAG